MPVTCIIVGCGSRGNREKVSFHRVPEVVYSKYFPHLNDLSRVRRHRWISAIKRVNLTPSVLRNQRVCSRHFLTGKPSKLEDVDNPDWIPSQHMGPMSQATSKGEDVTERITRVDKRKLLAVSRQNEEEIQLELRDHDYENAEEQRHGCASQTDGELDSTTLASAFLEVVMPDIPKLEDRIEIDQKQQQKKSRLDSSGNSEGIVFTENNIDPKLNRQVLVGWLCSEKGQKHVQMKCSRGGGTLILSMLRTAKKDDIIEVAKSYFFDKGEFSKDLLCKFTYDLWDSMRRPVKNDITVDEMFHQCRQTRLRLYLVSTEIIPSESKTNRVIPKISEEEIVTETKNIRTPEHQTQNTLDSDYVYFDEFGTMQTSPSTSHSYEQSLQNVNPTELIVQEMADVPESTGRHIIHTLAVHRGHILEEFIEAFQTHSDYMHGAIQVQIINTNGKVEAGFDSAGTLRDCLSEFWSSFYDRFTIGTDYKVPILRHDMDLSKWSAVAKILYKGWKDEGFFPIKLCPAFIEYCLYGRIMSDIYKSFLNCLSANEKRTITAAMEKLPQDNEDLLEILQSLECRVKITPHNFKQTLLDIAHKEIIQKPMFVIDCWSGILNNLMPFAHLENVYQHRYPSAKNIIAALNVEENMDRESTRVYGYLKKYIRDTNEERRNAFLRFATGANMLTDKKIVVTFNDLRGIKKIPVAHTCGFTIEIPKTYENFPEFRMDFNNLFDANV